MLRTYGRSTCNKKRGSDAKKRKKETRHAWHPSLPNRRCDEPMRGRKSTGNENPRETAANARAKGRRHPRRARKEGVRRRGRWRSTHALALEPSNAKRSTNGREDMGSSAGRNAYVHRMNARCFCFGSNRKRQDICLGTQARGGVNRGNQVQETRTSEDGVGNLSGAS